jgi:hypothetical protein
MTQLEMMTSTELSGSGIFSISPFRNSAFSMPAFFLILPRKRQHFVRHIEPIRLSLRADTASRKQYVDAAAGAKIEDNVSGIQRPGPWDFLSCRSDRFT